MGPQRERNITDDPPDSSAQDTSAALLTAAAAGDVDAFGRFYDLHVESVLRYFYRRTSCADLAADLTAETFAAVLESIKSFRSSKGSGVAWLFGIARNVFTRFLRKQRLDSRARQRIGMSADIPLDADSFERIEELVDFEPCQERLREALSRLSPKLAEAVRLRVIEGLPYAAVARRLQCSEVAARARVSRALSRLGSEIGDDYEQ